MASARYTPLLASKVWKALVPIGKGEMKAPLFDIAPIRAAKSPVTLATIKADERFKDFDLVRLGRLSVMPVPKKLDTLLRKMAGL